VFHWRINPGVMATKIHKLFLTLSAIIVMACLFGVQGQFQEQYVAPSSGYSSIASSAAHDPIHFAQFYTMTTGPAPSNPIGAPQQFEIAGNVPSTLYLGEQMYPVPYSQYQSDPVPAGANSLWIKGITNWTQYVAVPQGATLALLAVSPTGGSGTLNFMDSAGQTYSHNYFFYPNSLLTFYAAAIGRHMLWFDINGQSSNQVIIDVAGTYAQPINYPEYYSGYYPGEYPEYYYPWDLYPWHCYPDYCVPSKPPCKNHKDGNDPDENHPDGNPGMNHRGRDFGGDKDSNSIGENHPDGNTGRNHEGRDLGGNKVGPGENDLGENPGLSLEDNLGGNKVGPGENDLGENPGLNLEDNLGGNKVGPGESNLGENPGLNLEDNLGGNKVGPGENNLGENPGMNREGGDFSENDGGNNLGENSLGENSLGEKPRRNYNGRGNH
jgi:hypothetical protein